LISGEEVRELVSSAFDSKRMISWGYFYKMNELIKLREMSVAD